MAQKQLKWKCVSNCGACCKLKPDERIEAIAALTLEDEAEYLNLVGDDGWCKNYDKSKRRCKVYNNRPTFCRVGYMTNLFGITKEMKELQAIKFCKQQIRSIYGGKSIVLKRFNKNLY